MQNRQKIALEYAIKYLHTSAISKHISDVILYGSVARGEERFKSDVDILIILHDDFLATYENKKNVRHIVSDLADPWETFEAVEKNMEKQKMIHMIWQKQKPESLLKKDMKWLMIHFIGQ